MIWNDDKFGLFLHKSLFMYHPILDIEHVGYGYFTFEELPRKIDYNLYKLIKRLTEKEKLWYKLDMIPLFKSHYSIGRSTLTFEQESERSIIDLATKSELKELVVVEDSLIGFWRLEGSRKSWYGIKVWT